MAGPANGQTQGEVMGPNGQRLTDPTRLTTEALMREIEILNKDLDRRFEFYDRLLGDADKQRLEQKKDSKDAIDAALAAAKEAVREQNAANEKAIGKSETMQQATIDIIKMDIIELKKFKDTAPGTQAAHFVSHDAYVAAHVPLVKDIEDLKLSRERDRGKQIATTAAVGLAFAIITVVLRFI